MLELLCIIGIIGWGIIICLAGLGSIGLLMLAFDWVFDTHIGRRCVRRFIAFMKDEGFYE